jgi:hypothetical protein
MQETCDTTHAKVMPGYKLISKSRTSKHGGGVGFLIRSDIAFKQNYSVFIEGLLPLTLTVKKLGLAAGRWRY